MWYLIGTIYDNKMSDIGNRSWINIASNKKFLPSLIY